MIEYTPIIVTQEIIDIATDDNLCIFIDTKFTVRLFNQLQRLSETNQIKIYQRISNKFASHTVAEERDYILAGKEIAKLEHYKEYDLLNSEFDHYLNLDAVKHNQRQVLLNLTTLELRSEVIESSVINYYIQTTSYLEQLVEDLFRSVDVDRIALTTNSSRFNTVQLEVEKNEILVARTNTKSSNQILIIEDEYKFHNPPHIVIINDYDYKYAIDNLFTKEYILGFNDNLESSAYFQYMLVQNNIKTVSKYCSQAILFPGQTINSLAVILLVQRYGHVQLSYIRDQQLITLPIIDIDNQQYKHLVLVYKHILHQKIIRDIDIIEFFK